jgi:hypothetical protein
MHTIQAPGLASSLENALGSSAKLDAVLCVSGGFTMGDAQSPQLLQGAEDMFARSVFPCVLSPVPCWHLLKTMLASR